MLVVELSSHLTWLIPPLNQTLLSINHRFEKLLARDGIIIINLFNLHVLSFYLLLNFSLVGKPLKNPGISIIAEAVILVVQVNSPGVS
jgi:positive regulator of sigma E activity